ncbi:glycosyltransferase [Candidatus Gracilibacteria bacterium]|nr:glycosyltransferase [Candidatus Gracilibacteria bacterium]
MKKLFFLINSLEGGGAERVVVNLASELSSAYDIDIITLKNINFYSLPKNVNFISLSNLENNLLMFLLIPFYVFKFRKIIKKNKYINGISFLEISNFVNILANKKAIISFRINISFFKGIIGFIYKLFIKILYLKAVKIIVNSEENRFSLANYLNYNINKIITIYNPVNIEQININKNESLDNKFMSLIKTKKVFITVGRLVWQKNHITILNSFKYIYDNVDKDFLYLIVGDGPKMNELVNYVKSNGLIDNVIFLGEQKNVFKYLNISNYFIYASEVEGFPNVLIEAMAIRLPIITSDFISGAKECILGNYNNNLKNLNYPYYGENGVLLDLKNYESNFLNVYKNLDILKQDKCGFEKFNFDSYLVKYNSILQSNIKS